MSNTTWTIIAFVIYTGVMIAIGGVFYKKSSNLSDYFLGGRGLNAWVGALSAQASDMSGWLLMGLPGAIYLMGTGQVWIAVGLCLGTLLNWIFVASRLRRYTIKSGNSLTLPEYFENRFRDSSRILRTASAIFIIIFFAVYTASAFVAGGKLFAQVFGVDYQIALFIGVMVILVYTFLGGFHAVCWTDLVQGIMMLIAILAVPIIALFAMGGIESVTGALPKDFLNPFRENGTDVSAISIISQLAWGLGYFGMPHILVRFMAIRSNKEIKRSRVIAMVWVVISLAFAAIVGIVGKVFVPDVPGDGETVFIQMIQKIFMGLGGEQAIVPVAFIGGLFLCGILAAIMSTADSQLLVTASSISDDIYKGLINKKASDDFLVKFSRVAGVVVAVVAYFIARDPESSVMNLVSNAWAGFGAAFGPLVLLSLFWRRTTRGGAAAGIIAGGLTVILWEYIPMIPMASGVATLSTATGLYSLVPGFALSLVCIVLFSFLTKKPSAEMLEEFDAVKNMAKSEE